MNARSLLLFVIPDVPLFKGGEDVGEVLVRCCQAAGIELLAQDVIVIAQKLVSKAEYRVFPIDDFEPSAEAMALSEQCGRDPRLCEAYLRESVEIVEIGRKTPKGRMVITRHKAGFVITAAGVDRSNLDPGGGEQLVLLPVDSDASASCIRERIVQLTGREVAVIINDSFGRKNRRGSIGLSIGFSGIKALETDTEQDLYGKPVTPEIALVDEISAAASILMGQGGAASAAIVVRGAPFTASDESRIRDMLL